MRKVIIDSFVAKDIVKFNGREQKWIIQIIKILEDETNSIEIIKQKFKPLNGELKGYQKAKHRGFGIRIVFKFLNNNEIEIMIDKDDEEYREMIELLAVGKRDGVYEIAKHRLKSK